MNRMSIGSVAASGMHAHQMMFAAAAHNVANVNTPDFQAQSVQLAARGSGGVDVAGVASGGAAADLADQVPATIVAEHGYTANARVLSAADEMSGALLDVIA